MRRLNCRTDRQTDRRKYSAPARSRKTGNAWVKQAKREILKVDGRRALSKVESVRPMENAQGWMEVGSRKT